MEEKKKSNVGLIILVVILLLACAGMGAFIFINKDKLTTKENTTTIEKNESNHDEKTTSDTKDVDLINNGERIGTYSIYMGKSSRDGGEYTLTMFYTRDKNEGSFQLVEATSMSYNQVAHGGYTIKDSYIEFYNNLLTDTDKNSFVNGFQMQKSDLYQEDDGYENRFKLKLNYADGKISNSNITLEKLY